MSTRVFEGYIDYANDSPDESTFEIFPQPDIPVIDGDDEGAWKIPRPDGLFPGDRPGALGLADALRQAKENKTRLRITITDDDDVGASPDTSTSYQQGFDAGIDACVAKCREQVKVWRDEPGDKAWGAADEAACLMAVLNDLKCES